MTDSKLNPILIVEDDEPTQRLIEAVLRRSGYPTETTSNGRGAIALLSQKNYAVVILDIMMPEVSGHEVVDALSGDPRGIPVVVCSAAAPSAFRGLDPRVVKAIVRKPFDVEHFLAIVVEAAARR